MSSPPSSKQRRQQESVPRGGGGLLERALIEVRPRLRSAYCFLRLAVDTAEPTLRLISVEVRSGSGSGSGGEGEEKREGEREETEPAGLDVCLEYRGRTVEQPVDVDCRLVALSGPVTTSGRYVVLRATLQPDARRGSAAAEVLPAPSDRPVSAVPLWSPTVPAEYRATCRQCGAAAVDARLSRALPLPSEDWREMLGNVFCHGDGADRSMHERVRARPGDCFYAPSHVVLSAEDVRCAADGSRLNCSTCSAPLGETVEFGARLWHHRVTWSSPGAGGDVDGGGGEELRLDPAQVLRRLLVHGAAACDAPTARLLASAPRHDALLLWLIDTSLTVHLLGAGSDVDGGDIYTNDSGAVGGRVVNGSGSGASDKDAACGAAGDDSRSGVGEDAPPLPGRARTAVKILYRSCDEEAARLHRADLAVKSLDLDDVLMTQLRAELERSQLWYPEPQRVQGDDRVGLIIL